MIRLARTHMRTLNHLDHIERALPLATPPPMSLDRPQTEAIVKGELHHDAVSVIRCVSCVGVRTIDLDFESVDQH